MSEMVKTERLLPACHWSSAGRGLSRDHRQQCEMLDTHITHTDSATDDDDNMTLTMMMTS